MTPSPVQERVSVSRAPDLPAVSLPPTFVFPAPELLFPDLPPLVAPSLSPPSPPAVVSALVSSLHSDQLPLAHSEVGPVPRVRDCPVFETGSEPDLGRLHPGIA